MEFKKKKFILAVISILCLIFGYFGFFVTGSGNELDLLCLVIPGFISANYVITSRGNLYLNAFFMAIYTFTCNSAIIFILSLIGLIISFVRSNEEDKISDLIKKNPIFYAIYFVVIGLGVLHYTALIDFFFRARDGLDFISELTAFMGIICLIFVSSQEKNIFNKKYKWSESIKVALPLIVFIILASFISLFTYCFGNKFLSLENVLATSLLYITVGFFEEVLLRGFILNILLDRFKKTRSGIWFSVILSSLLFGIAHMSNLSTGASFFGVLMQVIVATGMGIYFGAIYIRTNNIYMLGLIHGFWDLMASIEYLFAAHEYNYGSVISGYSLVSLVPAIIYLFLALFLLRKNKIKRIVLENNNEEIKKEKSHPVYDFFKWSLAASLITFSVLVTFVVGISYYTVSTNTKNYYKDYIYNNYYIGEVSHLFNGNSNKEKEIDSNIKMTITLNTWYDTIKENNTYIITKDLVDSKYKKLFNAKPSDYPNVSYGDIICKYDDLEYQCKYEQIIYDIEMDPDYYSNTYIGIKTIDMDLSSNKVRVYIYYLYEENNCLYADSSKNYIVKDNISLKNNKVEYDEDDYYNVDFFESLDDIDIPEYVFEFDVMDDEDVYLSHIYLNDSYNVTYDVDTKESIDVDKYDSYSFTDNGEEVFNIRRISTTEYIDNIKYMNYYNGLDYYYSENYNVYLYGVHNKFYRISILDEGNFPIDEVIGFMQRISFND